MKKRIILSLSILIIWALFAGAKLTQYYQPPKGSVNLAQVYREQTGLNHGYYGIYMAKTRIGFMKRLMMKSGKGYKLFEEGVMNMSFLGEKRKLSLNLYCDLDDDYRLRVFVFQLVSDKENVTVRGEMGPSGVTVTFSGAERTRYTVPLKERPVVPSAIIPFLVKSGFERSGTLRIPVFDPSSVAGYVAEIALLGWEIQKVEEREVRAFHIKTSFKGIEVHAWIDEAGDVVKEVSPVGLTALKEKEDDKTGYFDVSSVASVTTEGSMGDTKQLSSVRLRIEAEGDLLDILGKYHPVRGDILDIERGKPAKVPGNPATYLEPSAFVDSRNADIVATARRIVPPGLDQREKARRIMNWVFNTVRKRPTFSIPLASQVLKNRAGDCNEHAVLFAGLARASGIPCVIASGIVYSQGKFFYHAWNLVHVDGAWFDVDSAFGEFPANPSHVVMALGDISDGLEVMRFMGKFKIKIIEAK